MTGKKPTPEKFRRLRARLAARETQPAYCLDCGRDFPCGCKEEAQRILLEEQFRLMKRQS